jgi:hypothetical protein
MPRLLSAVSLALSLVIAGCGGGDSADANSAAMDASAGDAGSAAVAGTATPLATTPLVISNALGATPPTVKETEPCPFLSDETARAAATTEFELTRRRVSNTQCVWNYNIGFEVSARVEPTASSRAFSERTYNMDVPAVLLSKSGPGQNAVVLADSTFGAPRPFAFGFELGDERIMLRITGMRTSEAQLQAAADEIARQLPNAPQIEPQEREEVSAFDPCATWSEASLRTLYNQPDDAVVSPSRSKTSCTYTIYLSGPERNVVTVGLSIFPAPPGVIESLKAEGWTEVSGAMYPTVVMTKKDQFGANASTYSVMHGAAVTASVSDRDGEESAAKAMALPLIENLAKRAVP